MSMFNLSEINLGSIANVLNSIDSAAKESLEEPKQSATAIRRQKKIDDDLQKSAEHSINHSTSNKESTDIDHEISENNKEQRNHRPSSNSLSKEPDGDLDDSSELTHSEPLDNDAKKLLAKRNKEIERLNAECLELENTVKEREKETKQAWDSYKSSQENAAAREDELQDAIKQLQRAKQLDKQQMLAHMTKANNDIDDAMKQKKELENERDNIQQQLDELMTDSMEWKSREEDLERALSEARAGSVQGVEVLRDELRSSQSLIEQLRSDHASMLRQSQNRQSELEEANLQLSQSLGEKQREISKLRQLLETSSGKDPNTITREVDGLRGVVDQMTELLEEEKVRNSSLDRKIRQLELESKAAVMSMDEERQRSEKCLVDSYEQIAQLEAKLRDSESLSKGRSPFKGDSGKELPVSSNQMDNINTGTSTAGDASDAGWKRFDASNYDIQGELDSLQTQVQDLSKQLLKKQAQLLDMQAERGALKSRVQDLQARCTTAERQVAALRDIELEGDDDFADDTPSIGSNGNGNGNNHGSGYTPGGIHMTAGSSSSYSLRRRGGNGFGDMSSISTSKVTVSSDLEKMGVHTGPAVKQAVDMVDSWTLVTGRFLRNRPLMRMGFVIYLVGLHLWVLFILAYQTHSLEVEMDPHKAIVARLNP